MKWSLRRLSAISWSELRGILLVLTGLATLAYYYQWWFKNGRLLNIWLALAFVIAVAYTTVQFVGNWFIYLATHRRVVTRPHPPSDLNVDVFVTACGEEPALVERTLAAACAMHGRHRTWLLDDQGDRRLAHLAERLGAGYLTRTERKHAKAGNINAALPRTDGDIIVIFDIDHIPHPDFLDSALSYFADPSVGFVQVMLTFANGHDGWIAQAASGSALDFYNPTSIGADGLRGATLVGSNALIRRTALTAVGGYQPGLAEDLATSIALHAAGWRSVYVAEPLAPGLAPPDLPAWFTQQLKWSRGVFELLLTAYPAAFSRLRGGQRLSYLVRMTYYWLGVFLGLHILVTLGVLFSGETAVLSAYNDYLFQMLPLGVMVLLIRQLALRRWAQQPLQASLPWQSFGLVLATWPIYTLGWLMALVRLPLSFRPTPKTISGRLPMKWLWPQILTAVSLAVGLAYAVSYAGAMLPWLVGVVACLVIGLHLLLIGTALRSHQVLSGKRPSRAPLSTATKLMPPLSDDPSLPTD